MSVRNRVLVAAAVLLLAGGTALAEGPVDVFVSNPVLGQIWKVPYECGATGCSWGSAVLLFEAKKIQVEDLVVGPDDRLYACAPDDQLLFSFDPAAVVPGSPLSDKSSAITKHYTGASAGPLAPQCGWFSDRGDLFLTDQMGDTAVWIYRNLVPLYPGTAALEPFVPADGAPVPANFYGQGVTQAAPGDLLFVDNANDTVWNLGFDPIFRFDEPSNPDALKTPFAVLDADDLDSPVGIARSAADDLFVTDGANLVCNADGTPSILPFDGYSAKFLAFTSNDRLFVATTSTSQADLWEVNPSSCTKMGDEPILSWSKPAINKPAMAGVAVSRTYRTGFDLGSYKFTFDDHLYEVDVDGCTPAVAASETPPECLTNLIENYVLDDPNDPGSEVTAFGAPVIYAGDNGVAQLYHVTKASGTCASGIGHAIAAYTDLVKNPRIIRCKLPEDTAICDLPEDPPTGAYCEIIELESFFPFNGFFPDDGRIAGTRSATDFSEYFFADITLSGATSVGDNRAGCFCGWESPLPDMFMLEDNPFDGLPVYNAGSSVPIKFRVAATAGRACGEDGYDYCAMPDFGYVTGARVLLSVAQIFTGNPDQYDETFVVYDPRQTNGDENNYFGNPNNPSTPYHYNLDTSDFDPGVYQAVAVALSDNFAVEWTYFAVR